MLWGPNGCGKTSVAYSFCYDHMLEPVEINVASSYDEVEAKLSSLGVSTFDGKDKCLIIEELEFVLGLRDVGRLVKKFLIKRKYPGPIIITSDDVYHRKMYDIRRYLEVIRLSRLRKPYIIKILKKVSISERVTVPPQIMEIIADESGGDARAALNDLQIVAASGSFDLTVRRNIRIYIYDFLESVFTGEPGSEVSKKFSEVSVDYEMLLSWIYENLPYVTSDIKSLNEALRILSVADKFNWRARRVDWKYLKYLFVIISYGLPSLKLKKRYVRYSFPSIISTRASAKRGDIDDVTRILASKCHCSKKDALRLYRLFSSIVRI